jgi:hypothetical protein
MYHVCDIKDAQLKKPWLHCSHGHEAVLSNRTDPERDN